MHCHFHLKLSKIQINKHIHYSTHCLSTVTYNYEGLGFKAFKIWISVTATFAASFFHGNQFDFTVNVLTRCEWSIQLEWRYGALWYLSYFVAVIILQNESMKIYFWCSCYLKYQCYIFWKIFRKNECLARFHNKKYTLENYMVDWKISVKLFL